MKRSLLFGALVVAVYVVGAAISTQLSPFGTQPVLDGLAPPPPYRWVDPPPDLAAANKKPFGGTFPLKFTGGRSEAGAFTTRDSQLSMILDPGALPATGNPSGASVSITPLGTAAGYGPSGYTIDGNVYRIEIKERPSGDRLKRFAKPQRVILVYPADHSFVKPKHLIAVSGDGASWTTLETDDSTVQQQSSALIRSPGLIAVVTPIKSESSSKAVWVILSVVAVLVLLAGGVGWWVFQRSKRSISGRR
jgi:hypothetical protein